MTVIRKRACHDMATNVEHIIRHQISSSPQGGNSMSAILETVEKVNMSLGSFVSIQTAEDIHASIAIQVRHASPQSTQTSKSNLPSGFDRRLKRAQDQTQVGAGASKSQERSPTLNQDENIQVLRSEIVEPDPEICERMLQNDHPNLTNTELHCPAWNGTIRNEGVNKSVVAVSKAGQLQIWVYEVSNINLTMAERLVKSDWEVPRLERL